MSEPFIGQIMMFGGNFTIRGWAFCDGQLLPISQNQALFAILGPTYGGDGRTTFGLPDLRGRVAIHQGNGAGLSNYNLGQRGGVETVTLNANQIPAHTHTATAHAKMPAGNSNDATGNFWSDDAGAASATYSTTADTTMNPGAVTLASIGGGQDHTNIQPYLAVNYLIALTGIFPSRN
jgi:microcystin-dependent protein